MADDKQTVHEVDSTTSNDMQGDAKEILPNGMISTNKHRFCTSLLTSNTTFKSSKIENSIDKNLTAFLLIYDSLILQHAAMKCILDITYETLMTAIMYGKFIT